MSAPSFLVIKVSRIGDTLFVTPVLRALAAAHPDARIDVLAHPQRAEVLDHLPFVRRVGAITKNRAPWLGHFGGVRYDYALVFGFDLPLVNYGLRLAEKVVAFRQADERVNRRLYRTVERPRAQSEHAVLQLLRLPGALGIPPAGMRLAYAVSPAESAWAADRLRLERLDLARPLIGLQVASFPTKAYRDWPIDYYAALCKQVVDASPSAGFLIFGGGEERTRTRWLKSVLGDRAALLAGKLTLRQTAALMSQVDAYVGVDTGPTHIMSTFDIPLVALYHCLSGSKLTGPLDDPWAYVVDHPRDSAACTESTPMAEITVERVWRVLDSALERGLSLRAARVADACA